MKIESKTVFLDTNVLIYQTFEDFDREKHLHVCHVLKYLSENNYKIYVSTQVLREFFSISTNERLFERPLEVEEALSKIDEFGNTFEVLYDNELSMTTLKEIVSKYKICKKDIYDANIAATIVANQLEELFTFNIKDFEFFDEIRLFKIMADKETHEQDTSEINNSSQ